MRLGTILLGLTVALTGCSMWQKQPDVSLAPLTPQQQAWWTANKNRAIYVPARGYYVENVGYFDGEGHPMAEVKAQTKVASSKPKSDPYEGWLYKRMTGQETADTATPTSNVGTGATPDAGAPVSQEESPSGWALFYPSNIEKSWLKLTGQDKNVGVSQSAFQEGENLYRQARYAEAAEKFKIAAKRWPDSAVEEDALFLQGESEFFQDRYPAANTAYGELLKKYPNSRHLDKVVNRRFGIARYWQQVAEKSPHWPVTPNLFDKECPWFDTEGHALATYDRIRMDDPTGPLADDAIMASGNAYFLKNRFLDADYYYDLLRKDYPRSEHLANAFKLGLQCKLRKYQGPAYDGTPLVEAEELVNQMLTQFPREMADERERLVTVRKEIHAQLAARDFNMGEYYDKGSHYGAARYYYASVVKKYPDSSFAQTAQQRMDAIKAEPDNPPDRLEFLARWFGEDKNPNLPTANPPAPTATATAPASTIQR
jgi:outer membrane protein assembly factor BamD (BamD/ComL family)